MQSTTIQTERKTKYILGKIAKIASVAGVLLVFLIAVAYIGITMGDLLGAIVAAAFIAYLLLPLQKFSEKHLPKWLAAIFCVLLSYGIIIIIASLLIPQLINQMSSIVGQISVVIGYAEDFISKIQDKVNKIQIPIEVGGIFNEGISYVTDFISESTKRLIDSLIGFSRKLPVIALTPVLTFYFLKDRSYFNEYFVFLIPVKWRAPLNKMFYSADKVIKSYVKTQLVVAFLVGLATMAGYFAVGVPYALLLGIFMGICEIIPYFGPVIGAIPACVLVLISVPDKLLWTIVTVVAVQQLEGNFLSPYLMGAHFDINPVTVIAALWVSGRLFGFAGFIFAIPIYVIFKDICKVVFNKLVKAG